MADLAQLEIRIQSIEARNAARDLKELEKQGKKAEAGTKRLGTEVKKTDKRLEKFRKTASSVGKTLRRMLAGFAAIAAVRAAIRTFASFEQTMANVRAVAIRTTDTMAIQERQFKSLSRQAQQLGASTRFSATEAAEAQLFLARAGFKVNEVLKATPATLRLSIAGALDLGRAADIASNVLSAFALEAEELTRVVDVLAATSSNSNTTVETLGESFKLAAPFAAALQVPIEDLSAAIGILGNAGIQGSMAGTSLRGIFVSLLKPTGRAIAVLERLSDRIGVTRKEFDITSTSLVEIFNNFNKASASAQDMSNIFSRLQISAALALKSAVGDMEELNEKTNKATDTSERMANIMGNTLTNAFKALGSAVAGVAINTGDNGFGRTLKDVANTIAGVIRLMFGLEVQTSQVSNEMRIMTRVTQVLLGLLVGFVTLKLALFFTGALVAANGLSGALLKLRAAIATHPIITLAVVVAAVGVAVFGLNQRFNEVRETTKTFGDELEGLSTTLLELQGRLDNATIAGDPEAAIAARIAQIKILQREANKISGFLFPEGFPGGDPDRQGSTFGTRGQLRNIIPGLPVRTTKGVFGEDREKAPVSNIQALGLINDEIAALEKVNSLRQDIVDKVKAQNAEIKVGNTAREASEASLAKVVVSLENQLEVLKLGEETVQRNKILLLALADATIKWGTETDKVKAEVAEIQGLFDRIDRQSAINKIAEDARKANVELGELVAVTRLEAETIGQTRQEIERAAAATKFWEIVSRSNIASTVGGFIRLSVLAAQYQSDIQKITKETEAFSGSQGVNRINGLKFAWQQLGTAAEKALGRMREQAGLKLDLRDLQDRLSAVQGALPGQEDDFVRSLQNRRALVSAYGNDLERINAEQDRFDKALADISAQQEAKQVAFDVANAFGGAFEDAILGANSFRDALKGLFRELQVILLRLLVIRPLVQGLGGALNSAVGGAGGALTNALGNQNQSFGMGAVFNSGRKERYQFGILNSPVTFPLGNGATGTAGELGPGTEGFFPVGRDPQSGELGVRNVGGGGGGGNVQVNMTVVTRDADSFRRSNRQIRAQAARAFGSGNSRGGGF